MIEKLLGKYLKRNKKDLLSGSIVHKISGPVLVKSDLAEFQFHKILIEEVKEYCEKEGFKIKKLILLTSFDVNFKEHNKGIKGDSDSKIVIVKEEGELIAQVFMGSWVKIK